LGAGVLDRFQIDPLRTPCMVRRSLRYNINISTHKEVLKVSEEDEMYRVVETSFVSVDEEEGRRRLAEWFQGQMEPQEVADIQFADKWSVDRVMGELVYIHNEHGPLGKADCGCCNVVTSKHVVVTNIDELSEDGTQGKVGDFVRS
jgi:hypothetical protein